MPDRDIPDDSAPHGPGEPSGAEQALRALEERLSRASEAAERLIAEAAGAAARGLGGEPGAERGGEPGAAPEDPAQSDPHAAGRPADPAGDDDRGAGRPPPAGWAPPLSAGGSARSAEETLIQFVRSLRDLIPPDLQSRLAEAVRELLLAVRALIDWYVERMERRRRTPAAVQDIPIL